MTQLKMLTAGPTVADVESETSSLVSVSSTQGEVMLLVTNCFL